MTLAEYIRNDLRYRIARANAVPGKLTISSLANHYMVSTMPVRVAVNALIAEKIFHKGSNGRLRINADCARRSRAAPRRSVPPPTDWAQRILDDAVTISLRGKAVQWKIADTADRYGLSPILVQTTFHRMAGSGVLEHRPRRGWWIRPFYEKDLDAYLSVRVTLELKALELSRDRLDRDILGRLFEANAPSRGKVPPKIDDSLHLYWVRQSGNRYIQDFFDRHGSYYATLYAHAPIDDGLLNEIARGHRAILQSLMERRFRRAADALSEDIQLLRPILIDTIRRLNQAGPRREAAARRASLHV